MSNLKNLNEQILKQTIKENIIFEAIDSKNINFLADQIEKMGNLINSSMPTFQTLKTALSQAEAEANKAATNPEKSKDTIGKVVSFFSKMWNFLSNDLKGLSRLPAMRDFFDPAKNTDDNSTLATSPNAQDIRNQLMSSLKNDNSPWFKKALRLLTNNQNYVSDIPYLNANSFVDEFLQTPRKTLKTALESVNNQIKTVQNPEVVSKTLATPATGTEASTGGTQDVAKQFQATQTELNKLYTSFVEKLGDKGKVPDNQVKIKQIIVNSFLQNENAETLEKKIQDEIK